MAKNIKNKKGLTVITNAERILLELSSCKDITLISTGGTLRPTVFHTSGGLLKRHKLLSCQQAVFICKGFSPKFGLTDSSEQESK